MTTILCSGKMELCEQLSLRHFELDIAAAHRHFTGRLQYATGTRLPVIRIQKNERSRETGRDSRKTAPHFLLVTACHSHSFNLSIQTRFRFHSCAVGTVTYFITRSFGCFVQFAYFAVIANDFFAFGSRCTIQMNKM